MCLYWDKIPIVQSIREGGDNGSPIVNNEDSMVGQSFIHLAEEVVKQVGIRNEQLPPTQKVETPAPKKG